MHLETPIDHRAMFEGFQNTRLLWERDQISGLKQFQTNRTSKTFVPKNTGKALRLGKWVEAYTSFQLQAQSDIEIIQENLQIINNKQTIGELDLLLLKNRSDFIHLEIAYKFYLYDITRTYSNPLEHWIGPNRNDSFLAKIDKLKAKQLPLLYHPQSLEVLRNQNLEPKDFDQYVCFKAQLYLPYQHSAIDIGPLNTECISGWHLNYKFIDELKAFKFHIPNKLDWLSQPSPNVNWLNYEKAQQLIKTFINDKQSPLCWLKSPQNHLQKCFITWW